MTTPHRVTHDEMYNHFAASFVLGAEADTADGTMRKRLVMAGAVYEVRRLYLTGPDERWETVFCGTNLRPAVDAYNRLS